MIVTFEGTTAAEVKKKIVDFVNTFNVIEDDPRQLSFPGIDGAFPEPEVEATPVKAKKASKKPKLEAAPVETQDTSTLADSMTFLVSTDHASPPPTLDDVKAVIRECFADDMPGARKLLLKYNANAVRDLKEEDFAKVIAEAEKNKKK